MAAPQITLYTDEIPNRNTQSASDFSDAADATMSYFLTVPDEYNELSEFINLTASAYYASANYKGNWSDLSGGYSLGISVRHNDFVWRLDVDITDITATEPSSENTDWSRLVSFSDVSDIYAKNEIKASQLVVTGPDGYTVPEDGDGGQDISDGEEVTYGWIADGDVTGITADSYGNITATSGVIYTEVLIVKNMTIDDYVGSVKYFNGTRYIQYFADDTSGITVSEVTSGYARISVDLAVLTQGFVAAGLSFKYGDIEILSVNEIKKNTVGYVNLIPTGSYGNAVTLDWSSTGYVASDFRYIAITGTTSNSSTGFGGSVTVYVPRADFLAFTKLQVTESTRDSAGAGLSYVGAINMTETTLQTIVSYSGTSYSAEFNRVRGIF